MAKSTKKKIQQSDQQSPQESEQDQQVNQQSQSKSQQVEQQQDEEQDYSQDAPKKEYQKFDPKKVSFKTICTKQDISCQKNYQEKPVASNNKLTKKVSKPSQKNNQKDEQKKNFLPGQKYPTPDQQDSSARAFYESLYKKNPKSQMARKFCLQYGLLQKDQATKLLKQIAKKK